MDAKSSQNLSTGTGTSKITISSSHLQAGWGWMSPHDKQNCEVIKGHPWLTDQRRAESWRSSWSMLVAQQQGGGTSDTRYNIQCRAWLPSQSPQNIRACWCYCSCLLWWFVPRHWCGVGLDHLIFIWPQWQDRRILVKRIRLATCKGSKSNHQGTLFSTAWWCDQEQRWRQHHTSRTTIWGRRIWLSKECWAKRESVWS